jgi:hypothetical protein
LTVTEAEVLAAMRGAGSSPPVPQALLEQDLLAADIGKTVSGTEQQFLKVVFALLRCCWQAKNCRHFSYRRIFSARKCKPVLYMKRSLTTDFCSYFCGYAFYNECPIE